jgi:hypothetical protein
MRCVIVVVVVVVVGGRFSVLMCVASISRWSWKDEYESRRSDSG